MTASHCCEAKKVISRTVLMIRLISWLMSACMRLGGRRAHRQEARITWHEMNDACHDCVSPKARESSASKRAQRIVRHTRTEKANFSGSAIVQGCLDAVLCRSQMCAIFQL